MDVYMQFVDSQINQFAIEDIEMSPNTNINENHNMVLEQLNDQNQPNLTVPNPSTNPSPLQNNEPQNKQENNQNQDSIQVDQTSTQNSNSNNNEDESNNKVGEATNPDEYEINKDNDPEKLNFYPEFPEVMVNSFCRTYQYNENIESEFVETELNGVNYNYRNYTEVTKENSKDKI